MNGRLKRMILGAITGVIVAAGLETFRGRLAGVHVAWLMLICGVAGFLIFAALEALSRRAGKGPEVK